jgi:hypothetical protein
VVCEHVTATGKNCPWCGRENPAEAETCFSCGTSLTGHDEYDGVVRHREAAKSRRRRRTVSIAVGIVVVVAVAVGVWLGVAGGKKTTQSDADGSQSAVETTSTVSTAAETTSSTEAPDPTPPTAKFGEALDFWGTSITVSSPQILQDAEIQALVGDGVDVYVVSVTIKNTGAEVRDYNLFYWQALDEDGASYDATLYLESQALDTGEIQTGETVRGNVGFEIPKGMQVVSVTYSPMLADQTAVWEH